MRFRFPPVNAAQVREMKVQGLGATAKALGIGRARSLWGCSTGPSFMQCTRSNLHEWLCQFAGVPISVRDYDFKGLPFGECLLWYVKPQKKA
jgi:hypothetical protein